MPGINKMPAIPNNDNPDSTGDDYIDSLLIGKAVSTDYNQERAEIGNDPIRRYTYPVDLFGGGFGGAGLGDSISLNLFYHHFLLSTVARRYYTRIPEISTPIIALKHRIFRNGLTVEKNPLMASETHRERLSMSIEEQEAEYEQLANFFDNSNGFERVLEEEMKAFYDSLNIYDCAYMLLDKNYENAKVTKTSGGGYRIDPDSIVLQGVESIEGRLIDIPLNIEGKPKKKYLFCPRHRGERLIPFNQDNVNKQCKDVTQIFDDPQKERSYITNATDVESYEYREINLDAKARKPFDKCDLPLIPVMYMYRPFLSGLYAGDRETIQSKTRQISGAIPLAASEVISARKREHTELYGRSIIPRLVTKLNIILGLDYMASNTFVNRPYPSHLLLLNTGQDNVNKVRQTLENTAKQKSDEVGIIAIQGDGGISGKVDVKALPTTLETIRYTELKQGVIREIATAFGVDTNSVTTVSGGVQAQSFQVQVITDVVESDIRILNRVLDSIVEAMGVRSWVARLQSPDSKEETARSAIQNQKITNIQALSRLGYNVSIYGDSQDAGNLDFRVTGTNARDKVDLDLQIAQVLLALAQIEQISAQTEQGELPPELQGVQENLNSLLGKGGIQDSAKQYIQTLLKTKTDSEKVFGGRTGGRTPTQEVKTPTQQGKTENLPGASGKSKGIKIKSDGTVQEPKVPGE